MLWLLSSAPSVQPEFILCVDAEKAFDQVNEMKNNIVVTWKQLAQVFVVPTVLTGTWFFCNQSNQAVLLQEACEALERAL